MLRPVLNPVNKFLCGNMLRVMERFIYLCVLIRISIDKPLRCPTSADFLLYWLSAMP